MKFHNIQMVGPFNNEHLVSLPTFNTSKDPGRLVWLTDGSLWYGETDRWVKIITSDGGGNSKHNDLNGRSDNDCHPISAITGLTEALRYAGMRWEIKNSSYQIEDHVGYLVDTTGGAVTATLPDLSGITPSATLGMTTEIVDLVGNFDSSSVIIDGNGEKIMGLNESLEMDTEWGSATLVYSDTAHGWIVTDGKSGGCSDGGGNGMEWSIISSSLNAQAFNGYFVDTENNAITLTLTPTPQQGDIVRVIDYNGFANTNNITIDPNGFKINGESLPLVIDTNRTSLFLVYSDVIEGWEIFDSNRSTNNEITVDTTIYLAPSAASQSPTGIPVGSDITGDGSAAKPFFSIKRAMEYLEDYDIKIGIYVTIKAFPGKYYYNGNHKVVCNNISSKFIKIDFPLHDTSNKHSSYITTDAVTVTNYSDYDLVTITVNDMGTDFYQFKANDYIKIRIVDAGRTVESNCNHIGFYKISSVDVPNKKITYIFKRHQSGGSYNTNHDYGLPTTPTSTTLWAMNQSTHIYYTPSNTTDWLFKSEFGFGSIKCAASCENYHYSSGFYIYDGVIHDLEICLSGFVTGLNLQNLTANFLYNHDYVYSTITSCSNGLILGNTTTNVDGLSVNNCGNGIQALAGSYISKKIDTNFVSAINNYGTGIFIKNSGMSLPVTKTAYDLCFVSYNDNGISIYSGSYNGNGILAYKNNIGVFGNMKSNIGLSSLDDPDTTKFKLYNNHIGLELLHGCVCYIPHHDISYNTQYGIYLSAGSIVIGVWNETVKNEISHNYIGIIATSSSTVLLENCKIEYNSRGCEIHSNSYLSFYHSDNVHNTGNGLYIYNSRMNLDHCAFNDNSSGLYIADCSTGKISSCTFNDNSSNGIISYNNNILHMNNTELKNNGNDGIHAEHGLDCDIFNANELISGNSGTDIWLYQSCRINIYTKHATPNTSPAKNTAPSYSNAGGGRYILETVY